MHFLMNVAVSTIFNSLNLSGTNNTTSQGLDLLHRTHHIPELSRGLLSVMHDCMLEVYQKKCRQKLGEEIVAFSQRTYTDSKNKECPQRHSWTQLSFQKTGYAT